MDHWTVFVSYVLLLHDFSHVLLTLKQSQRTNCFIIGLSNESKDSSHFGALVRNSCADNSLYSNSLGSKVVFNVAYTVILIMTLVNY